MHLYIHTHRHTYLCIHTYIHTWGGDGGHASQKASALQLPTTPPTRGPPVEAERVADDRILAGISEPIIPELRKKKDGEGHRRWRWCLHKNTGRKATGNHLSISPKTMASQKTRKPRTCLTAEH